MEASRRLRALRPWMRDAGLPLGAGAVAAAVLSPFVGPWAGLGVLVAGFLFGGFHRLIRADLIVSNTPRRNLLRHVLKHPGTTVGELGLRIGIRRQTVTYHLNLLREFDLVSFLRDGSAVRVFPSMWMDAASRPAEILMARRWARQVLDAVAENPGASARSLAKRLGVSHTTARWYLAKLAAEGAIVQGPDGQRRPVLKLASGVHLEAASPA